ncbi:TadE/TadG family type IV pilus assembly protein [Roseivivax sp. CAU 1753]
MRIASHIAARFLRCDSGSFTIAAMFLLLAGLMLGSLSIDFMRRTEARTDLQITADSVAHTAIVLRQSVPEGAAKTAALLLAQENSAVFANNAAIAAADIEFGIWNKELREFIPQSDAKEAVRVRATRDAARGNYVTGLLSPLLGVLGFEIAADSVFAALPHPCVRNGIIAKTAVEMTSNNYFAPGYCVHSDQSMKFSQSNTFDENVSVTMPDISNLTLPGGSLDGNPGLAEALHNAPERLDIDKVIADFRDGIENGDDAYIPETVQFALDNIVTVANNGAGTVTPEILSPGNMYNYVCLNAGTTLSFDSGIFRDIVLWTNCKISFGSGTALEGSVIYQDNTSQNAVKASSGLRLGAIDDCAPTGNTVLITEGGMHTPSNLELHGSAIVARGDVSFAAKPDGVNGSVIMSGGTVSSTSSGAFGFCDADFALSLYEYKMVQ